GSRRFTDSGERSIASPLHIFDHSHNLLTASHDIGHETPGAMRRRDVSESARTPEHRPGAPKSPITHGLILDSAPLPGHFEYEHRRRHGDVEALRRTGMRNRDPLVDRGIVGETVRLVAD